MAKNLPAIRATVRQFLLDEFKSGSKQDFQNDEIDLHIGDCLIEISERRPYLVKVTLTTTSGSRELDISSIEDLLEIDKLEYKTGNNPRDYRNFNQIDADTIEIDTTLTPGDSEDVYVYCHKVHQLTESTSTLKPPLERLLIDGVVAKVALSWINQVRAQVKEADAKIANVNSAIGNMSVQITQAMADLTAGRAFIEDVSVADDPAGKYGGYASRELANANSSFKQSQGYLREMSSRFSASSVINSYQNWANNKLVLYQADLRRVASPKTSTEYTKS